MSVDHIWDRAAMTKSRVANKRRAAIVRAARRAKEQAERAAALELVTPIVRRGKRSP